MRMETNVIEFVLAALKPVFARINELDDKVIARPIIVAIDGRAASGKTTASSALAERLGGSVIHMDDFFLPPHLRTDERYNEPGGNFHRERFAEEVLPRLKSPEAFEYVRFDCLIMDYGAKVPVTSSKLRIVEGSYSEHPALGEYADIKVFCDVSPDEQMRRITVRNGKEKAAAFRDRWIPLEEKYFTHFSTREKADIVI